MLMVAGIGILPVPARTAPAGGAGTALEGVTLAAAPPSPQPPNTPITLTATASGGTAVEYKFQMTGSDGVATVLRFYGPSPVCTWQPPMPDTYVIQVWAREAGTQQDPKLMTTMPYTISTHIVPLTGVNVLVTPSDAGTVNQPITIAGQAIGGTDPRYQFWIGNPASTAWTLLQDYTTASAISWTPTAAGTFPLVVRVKEAGSANLFDKQNNRSYPVTPGRLSAVALSVSPPAPQHPLTPVTLTASAAGSGMVEYRFQVIDGTGALTVPRDYAAAPSCVWTPAVADTYTLQVLGRLVGYAWQSADQASIIYRVGDFPLSAVSLTATPVTGAIAIPIALTAQSSGGDNIQYQFWQGASVGNTINWTALAADYQAAPTASWTPLAAGTYLFKVTARETGKAAIFASKILTVAVKPLTGAQSVGPLQITRFAENKAAAISYTFDDGYQSQLEVAAPLLDRYHYLGTFNVITGFTRQHDADPQLPTMEGIVTGSWEGWACIAATGHEIGNHTKTHPDMTRLTDPARLDDEINGSANIIAAHIGHLPFTFAFPYNHENAALDALALQRHHAIRENEIAYGNGLYTAAEMNAAVDQAIRQGQWLVPQMHGFLPHEYGPVSPEIFNAHLAYVQSHAADLWVDTYGHVSRYVQERDHAALNLDARQDRQLQFTLTCTLDPVAFDAPLTVRITTGLPTVVAASATLLTGGAALPATIQPGGIILLNIVPGRGPVVVNWQ